MIGGTVVSVSKFLDREMWGWALGTWAVLQVLVRILVGVARKLDRKPGLNHRASHAIYIRKWRCNYCNKA